MTTIVPKRRGKTLVTNAQGYPIWVADAEAHRYAPRQATALAPASPPPPPPGPRHDADERVTAVLAIPEAGGRRSFATYLASHTDMSIAECRTVLALAPADPGEIAADVMRAHKGEAQPVERFRPDPDAEAKAEAGRIVVAYPNSPKGRRP